MFHVEIINKTIGLDMHFEISSCSNEYRHNFVFYQVYENIISVSSYDYDNINHWLTIKDKYHDELLSFEQAEKNYNFVEILDILERIPEFDLMEFHEKKHQYIQYYWNRSSV